jgi:hypothetical protein
MATEIDKIFPDDQPRKFELKFVSQPPLPFYP